ncbi:MBL fold metallo-hydrolase [Dyella silvatica]|uniref:MBL fold metallo-hydrolase n=1 Tax=Dyella silvatica TaxID=2992128 RepID=UPI00224DC6D4|nr:MBL fold metallo-hydrolase [Dyella silvatica]
MKPLLYALLSVGLLLAPSAHAQLAAGSMAVQWNPGAEDCAAHPQPPLQVHPYNAQTFILRENPCSTEEAPFMYLLLGSSKALLIDSGDVADAKLMPLASTVMSLLPGEAAAKLPLLIVHTHGHLDHRSGDAQFQQLAHVDVVGTDLAHVRQYFGFKDWPNGVAQIDLGDRIVEVVPTPGHYPSHLTYYDRTTGLLFSGDFFMPGRLIIDDAEADKASAQRIVDFVSQRPLSYVLGGHIELDADGQNLPMGGSYHPHEHPLPMSKQDLLGLPAVLAHFNGIYSTDGIFVMYNQTRMLWLFGAGVIAVLLLIGLGVRALLRRRNSRRLLRAG